MLVAAMAARRAARRMARELAARCVVADDKPDGSSVGGGGCPELSVSTSSPAISSPAGMDVTEGLGTHPCAPGLYRARAMRERSTRGWGEASESRHVPRNPVLCVRVIPEGPYPMGGAAKGCKQLPKSPRAKHVCHCPGLGTIRYKKLENVTNVRYFCYLLPPNGSPIGSFTPHGTGRTGRGPRRGTRGAGEPEDGSESGARSQRARLQIT